MRAPSHALVSQSPRVLPCSLVPFLQHDGKICVHWQKVSEGFSALGLGPERSVSALASHFRHDHPEGPSLPEVPHSRKYAHAEDVLLMQLIDEHVTMHGKRGFIDWDAVEQGMSTAGFTHSIAGLKAHASKLKLKAQVRASSLSLY